MPWTTPTDRLSGYTVTAADWNIVEDDLSFLYGDTAWTVVSTFTNSWTAGAGFVPRYSKTGNMVTMQGVVTGGTLAAAAFTLPAGYRPTGFTLGFAVAANNAFGRLTVTAAGLVIPTIGSTTNVDVACTFSAL